MKKINIILIIFIIVAGILLTYNIVKKDSNKHKDEETSNLEDTVEMPVEQCEKILSISDISKNCFSSVLVVCKNNKYQILKGAYIENENPIIREGKYEYDIDKLINEVKIYPSDNETGLNYKVSIASADRAYIVSSKEATEVNNFINSLNEESIFWCN